MAGSIARRPFRIGLLLLLLAAAISFLLLFQFTCSRSDDQATISETGGAVETVESGGAAAVADGSGAPPAGVQADAGGPGGAATGSGGQALLTAAPAGGTAGSVSTSGEGGQDPPQTGVLSGRVEDDLGTPLTGISVYLADVTGNLTGEFTVTDAGGRFSFSDRLPGSYKLYFSDPSAVYESGWYGPRGAPSGTTIQVAPGSETSISHAMALSWNPVVGSITGRVTEDCDISVTACDPGVADVLVMAMYVVKDSGLQMTLKGTALTDSNGYYRIGNLPSGDYMVSFRPPPESYAFQWYRGQQSFATAEILPLSAGDTIGKVDANLKRGGTITGLVTGEGVPLPAAVVDIYDETGVIVDSAVTDAAGRFTSSRLPEGDYRVKAKSSNVEYLDEWYNDKHDFASADAVRVEDSHQTTGVDLDLAASTLQITPPPAETRSMNKEGQQVEGGQQIGDGQQAGGGGEYEGPSACEDYSGCGESINGGPTDPLGGGGTDGAGGDDPIEEPVSTPPTQEQAG